MMRGSIFAKLLRRRSIGKTVFPKPLPYLYLPRGNHGNHFVSGFSSAANYKEALLAANEMYHVACKQVIEHHRKIREIEISMRSLKEAEESGDVQRIMKEVDDLKKITKGEEDKEYLIYQLVLRFLVLCGKKGSIKMGKLIHSIKNFLLGKEDDSHLLSNEDSIKELGRFIMVFILFAIYVLREFATSKVLDEELSDGKEVSKVLDEELSDGKEVSKVVKMSKDGGVLAEKTVDEDEEKNEVNEEKNEEKKAVDEALDEEKKAADEEKKTVDEALDEEKKAADEEKKKTV